MRLGLVFECGPQGADKQVCEYLIKHIQPSAEISSKTLDTKINVLRDAGKVTAQLLNDGCSCVIIIWDLRPAWPDRHKPCRYLERQTLLAGLAEAGVPSHAPVHLVCIEQELESWLLASDHAIAALLSSDAHAYRVARSKRPDAVPQPKALLKNHFKKALGWTYDGNVDAIRILTAAKVDLARLRRSTSFGRFENKLINCADAR